MANHLIYVLLFLRLCLKDKNRLIRIVLLFSLLKISVFFTSEVTAKPVDYLLLSLQLFFLSGFYNMDQAQSTKNFLHWFQMNRYVCSIIKASILCLASTLIIWGGNKLDNYSLAQSIGLLYLLYTCFLSQVLIKNLLPKLITATVFFLAFYLIMFLNYWIAIVIMTAVNILLFFISQNANDSIYKCE